MKTLSLFSIPALLSMIVFVACSSPTVTPSAPVAITVVNLQSPVPTKPPVPTTMPTQPPAPTSVPTLRPTDPPPPVPQRVSFATGQSSTSVQGSLAKNGMNKWVLRINGGQTLVVNLVPTNGKAKITIVGADGYPLITDHADAMQWSGRVNGTQDYEITVIAFDDTAPSYSLQVTVPPVQPQPVQPTAAPVARRISFAPNSIVASETGTLAVNTSDTWVLKVMAGQIMSVNLVMFSGNARLIIYGVDGTVLISDHADATSWSGPIPITQDYIVKVSALGNVAASYRIEFTIPPK